MACVHIYFPGYKLAFNYLKAKRYVDAIDVCHKVSSYARSEFNLISLSEIKCISLMMIMFLFNRS